MRLRHIIGSHRAPGWRFATTANLASDYPPTGLSWVWLSGPPHALWSETLLAVLDVLDGYSFAVAVSSAAELATHPRMPAWAWIIASVAVWNWGKYEAVPSDSTRHS